jgi:hypothetical protein
VDEPPPSSDADADAGATLVGAASFTIGDEATGIRSLERVALAIRTLGD